jgi:PAS domain S-box-containing protein
MSKYPDNPTNNADLLDKLGMFLAGAKSGEKFPIDTDPIKILDELKSNIANLEKQVTQLTDVQALNEQEETRRLLQENTSLLTSLAQNSPDHIIIMDSDLRYRMVINPQLGLTAEEMIGKTDYDISPGPDADRLTEIKRSVIETGKSLHYTTSLLSKCGNEEFFDGLYVPKTGKNGMVDGLIGYFRNVTDIKNKETELQDTLESIADGFYAFDENWNFVYINNTAETMLDLRREEVLGKGFWDIFAPTIGSRLEKEYKAAAAGEVRTFENLYEPWNKWYLNRCFPRKGGGCSVYIREITEQKKSEEQREQSFRKLTESEEKLRQAHEIARIADWTIDKSGKAILSEELLFFSGLDPSVFQANKDNLMNTLHPTDKLKWEKWLESILKGQYPGEMIFRAYMRDGSLKYLSNRGRLFLDEHGQFDHMACTIQDITDRMTTEEALRESELQNTLLLENVMDGVLLTSPTGAIFSANRAICVMLGMSEMEICEYGRNKIVDLNDPRLTILLEERARKGKAKGELNLIHKDGSLIPVEISSTVYADKDGELRTSMIIRDIRDRIKAEEQREEVLRQLKISEENLKLAHNIAKIGTWTNNFKDQIWWSDEIYKIFGFDQEKYKPDQTTLDNLVHPEDKGKMQDWFKNWGKGIHQQEMIWRAICNDGTLKFIKAIGKAVLDEAGKFKYLAGISQDVTEAVLAENAVRDSEQKFAMAFKNSPATITLTTPYEGRFIEVNETFLRDMEYTREEVIGHTTVELSIFYDNDERDAIIRELKEKQSVSYREATFRKKSGEAMTGLLSIVFIQLNGETVQLSIVIDITERKIASDNLRLSEQRFRQISSTISDIAYSCVSKGQDDYYIDWIYGAVEKIMGYSQDEIISMRCWGKIVAEEDFGIFIDHVMKIPVGQIHTSQMRLRRKDGEIIWIETTSECCQSLADPDIKILYGGILDITDRKQAVYIIQKSEEKYRLLAENSDDVIWTSNELGQFTYVSPSIIKLRGYTPEEVMKQSFAEALTPESYLIVAKAFKDGLDLIANGIKNIPVQTLEIEQPRKDGSAVWTEAVVRAVFDKDGNFAGFLGISRDISERKLAAEKLKLSEEKYRLLAENSADVIWMTDTRGYYTYVSPAVEKLYGYKPEEAIGISMMNAVPEEQRTASEKGFVETVQYIQSVGKEIQPFIVELEQLRKDGSRMWVETLFKALFDGNDQFAGFLGITRDTTERKKAQRQTEKLTRDQLLVAQIAHNLVGMESRDQMYNYIAKHVYSLCNDAYLIMSFYDEENDVLVLKSAFGFNKQFEGLQKVFGINPYKMGLALKDFPAEEIKRVQNRKLNLFEKDGIYKISGGMINRKIGNKIEDFLGIKNVFLIGISWNDKIYGAFGILSKSDLPIENQALIETIVNQSAIAIQRLYTSEELKRSESRYRTLVENSPDGIGLFNLDGSLISSNLELAKILGFRDEIEFLNHGIIARDWIAPQDRPLVDHLMSLLVKNKFVPLQVHNMLRKDGSVFPAEVKSVIVHDEYGKSPMVLSIIRDVTERIKAEEALAKYNEQLRNFAGHNEMVREKERLNLARDIHDILGSSLAAVKMELAYLKQLLSKDVIEAQPEIPEQIGAMEGQIDDSVETMRKIVRELRPGILDELGLLEAIRWYAGEIQKRSGLIMKLKVLDEDTGIEDKQSIIIFRIFQEIMTNIVLHAKATQVKIAIGHPNIQLFRLIVTDNGVGMDEDDTFDPNSFGLQGMRERALLLNGSVKIESTKGKGTKIIVDIPVKVDKILNN